MNHQYVPRDYLDQALECVFVDFARGERSCLVVMATGVGKTELYLQIAERYLNENSGRVLIIAHREELISQPAKRWRRNRDEWPVIEMAELRAESSDDLDLYDYSSINPRIVLASVQTLNSGKRCRHCTADCQPCQGDGKVLRDCEDCHGEGCGSCAAGKRRVRCSECEGDGWICIVNECKICFEHFIRRMQKFSPEEFGLIIIDEAHHSVSDSYTRIVRYVRHKNQAVLLLGLTATPDRTDEDALGRVYGTVSFEYNLPRPILDGWLTPIDQQFVTVDDLNLANVRTTAGDLNSGDLEREMTAEKVLHKVTTPLVEIACGLEPGTIEQLINSGRLDTLQGLCTKREPTLVHCVDVAHAERTTEIINRYFPDSALCIIGTTPKNLRRDGLKRFSEGGYQFLLSCGVFLEGTDLPNVSVIGMARPTKSRALYSQMLGRGLRPLSGLVDGVATADERVRLIAESAKPKCRVIDFVGNSGRHKLICSADVLGDAMPDDVVESVIRKLAREGQPVDMLRMLMAAQEEAQEKLRRQAFIDAQDRAKKEDEAKRRAAQRRAGVVAGVTYTTQEINPFDVFQVAPKREPAWHRGRKPSEAMKTYLRNAKVPFTEETTFWEVHQLIDALAERRKKNLCTYKQAQWLQKHGYSAETGFQECQKIMNAWASNGWKRPAPVSMESHDS